MSTNIKPENRRLLEAVEYIDEDIILGVLSELRMPKEKHIEPVMTWRTPLKHWKSIAVLAACVVLLAFASPTASFISQVISNYSSAAGGNAGAGESSNIELNEYGSPYERAIDAYPADMPAEEIYADVLKGGWVVGNITNFGAESGIELWIDFYNNVTSGKEARILIAEYWDSNPYFDALDISYNKELNGIHLLEIVFDGQRYTVNSKYFMPEGFYVYALSGEETESHTYQYLICDDKYYDEGVCFILSDDATMTIEKWRSLPDFEEDRLHILDAFDIIKLKWQDFNAN